MKKFLFLILAAAFTFASCEKKPDAPAVESYQVEFAVGNLTPIINSTKGSNTVTVPECSDLDPDYATITINGTDYNVDLYADNQGNLHTEVVKVMLPDGTVTGTVSGFYLFHDVAPVGVGPEDSLVMAAPLAGSEYQQYLENKLDIDFAVEPFKKTTLDVDVLCYNASKYEEFGFLGSNIHLYEQGEICLFGDVCIDTACFKGSLYEQQESGLQYDVPAIIEAYIINSDGDTVGSASNVDWLGEHAPLCVKYVYKKDSQEKLTLGIDVYLSTQNGFEFVNIANLPFIGDGDGLDLGDDGILDFVLGNCGGKGDYVWTQGCQVTPEAKDSVSFYIEKYTNSAYLDKYQSPNTMYSYWYPGELPVPVPALYWIYLVHNGVSIQNEWSYGSQPYSTTGHPEADTANLGTTVEFYYYSNNTCDKNFFYIQLNDVWNEPLNSFVNIQRDPDWDIFLHGNEKILKDDNGVCNIVFTPDNGDYDINGFQYKMHYDY
jgi:hypothetical protein